MTIYAINARVTRIMPQPVVGATTAGIGVLAATVEWLSARGAGPSGQQWAVAIALAGAIVAAYHFPVHVRHQTKIALVTMVYYLLAVLVPPALAAVAAGCGALAAEVLWRRYSGAYPSDIGSEAGRRVLIVLVGSLVAHAGTSAVSAPVALVGSALVLAALDALTLPLVLAPIAGDRPLHVLVSTTKETAVVEFVQYAVGVVGAAAATTYLWTLAFLIVPCVLLNRAFKVMKEMHESTRHLLENMADAVDLRDQYTGGHSRRVTQYAATILRELRLHGPEVDLVETAARVHDIGKIGVSDAILNKPGPLTPEERAEMEAHPVRGADLLKRHGDFARGVAIVRHHHEAWDGKGYPDGLKGTEIPFGARVIAVADSFDAMTSDRPYRKGMTVQKAADILYLGRGGQWDASIVDAFLRTISGQLDQQSTNDAPTRQSTAPGSSAAMGTIGKTA